MIEMEKRRASTQRYFGPILAIRARVSAIIIKIRGGYIRSDAVRQVNQRFPTR